GRAGREQPPHRVGARDRPHARRRRREADQRAQPLPRHRHRRQGRRPDGPGGDRRHRAAASRSRRDPRRRRGTRPEERDGDDGDREVDQRDHPELTKGERLVSFRNLRLPSLAGFLAVGITLAAVASVATRAHAAPRAQLTVYAAASLTDVFPKIDSSPRYSFGGSNTLAAQIRQGAPADVFASANTALPAGLYADKL